MLFHTLLHPPFPWERGKGRWSSVWRRKKICSLKNLNQKFEKGACEGGKGACAGGLLGAATDLAPEDLMAGAAEIQGALCWHQWWVVLAMGTNPCVSCQDAREYWDRRNWHSWHIGGSLLRQGHGRRRAPLAVCFYFPLHRSSVSSVFDDLSFSMVLPCSKADYLSCITQHTQLARPSSFRETHTGALNCEIPKWTSKKFELATKVLCFHDTVMHSFFSHDPRFISFHTILDSAYSHTFFLFTRS